MPVQNAISLLSIWRESRDPFGVVDLGTFHIDNQYDANQNINQITSNAGTTSFAYDDLNQLTQEKLPDGTTIDYGYDAVGNRTSKKTSKSGATLGDKTNIFNDLNQLVEIKENNQTIASFSYDLNGNLSSDGSKTYVFNDFNQLIEIKENNQTIASYTYDEDGKRISSYTPSSGTINYFYDGDKVLYETDGNNNVLREYTYNENGIPLTMTMNGYMYYYLFNHHGDIIGLTDTAGNVVASYTYDAWGNILTQTGPMAAVNPYRYAGYRYDENTKLYYLMARYYNPDTGVFLSIDPVRGDMLDPITQNGYNYANNNPVMMVDPDGTFAISNAIKSLSKGLKKALIFFIKAIFKDLRENTVINILLIAGGGGLGAWGARKLAMKEFTMLNRNVARKTIIGFISGALSSYSLGKWFSGPVDRLQYIVSKFYDFEGAFDKYLGGKYIDYGLTKVEKFLIRELERR